MLSIVIHTKDYLWANAFKNFVDSNTQGEFEVIVCDTNDKFDTVQDAVYVFDEKMYDAGLYTDDRSVCLTETPAVNEEVFSVYKYQPADELLGRLSKICGNKLSSSCTKHYIFSSGANTSSSWIRAKKYARELSEQKSRVLLISFAQFDVGEFSKIQGDNFAKFAYYASVSDKRLAVHMRNLLVKSPSGYCVIPKPYLFDISQWSEFCTRSVINGVGYSDDFDVIIWHFDGIYAESFIPLYKICEKLFWTTIYHDLREDLSLKLLSDKCDRDFANTAKCFYEQHDERAVWS